MKAKIIALILILLFPSSIFALEGLTISKPIKNEKRKIKRNGKSESVELKPLIFGTSVLINSNSGGDADTTVMPIIDAVGSISYSLPQAKAFNYFGDIKLSLKPEPASSNIEDVSQTIRTEPGTFSFNAGWIGNYFYYTPKDEEGPVGIDIKAAIQFSYQRAKALDDSDSEDTNDLKEFGILSPELRAGIYLKHFFIGYKYTYNMSFGKESSISDEIDDSNVHKFVLVTAIESAAKDTAGNKEKYYFEFNYTSSRNSLNDGSFGFALTRAFTTFW